MASSHNALIFFHSFFFFNVWMFQSNINCDTESVWCCVSGWEKYCFSNIHRYFIMQPLLTEELLNEEFCLCATVTKIKFAAVGGVLGCSQNTGTEY